MANFADILDKDVGDVEKPKPLPVGTYLCIVQGPGEFGELGKNQTPAIKLKLKPMQAREDVDQTALNDMGGIGERTFVHTLWMSEDAQWRAKEFFAALGIDVGKGRKWSQILADAPNRQCYVSIKHRPSDDGTTLYTEITKVSAA